MQKLPEPYQSLFEAVLWDCGAEAIPELVRKGADLSYCDPNTGRTALYAATLSDRVKVVEALLKHGADPNQRFSYRSPVDGRVEANRIALHYASSRGAAIALINAGADVTAADTFGTTPLMRAAFHGHAPVVSVLLKAGASALACQLKQRGQVAHTARELAESKAKFFRKVACDKNRESAEQRIHCYEEICATLLEAEKQQSKTNTPD